MKKTKKQHYVPRCYLEHFQIPGSYQIHVYDKNVKKTRINSIHDIASENYFYDIKFSEILPDGTSEDLLKSWIPPEDLEDEQYIEHFLATTIETEYGKILRDLTQKVETFTPWSVTNCFFITEAQKFNLSVLLAMQYIRTKTVRIGITETADCLNQALNDMNATSKLRDSMKFTKEDLKYIHGKMILSKVDIFKVAQIFDKHAWILAINQASKMFYTSDSPIGTKAHLSDPNLSMAGISSKGVEVFFPVTPKAVLIMLEKDYHKSLASQDRSYHIITDTRNIDSYNFMCALRSDRCIYSTDGDFTLIEKMVNEEPQVFNINRVELHWGGNTYRPRKT